MPKNLLDESRSLKNQGDKYFDEGELDNAAKSYRLALSINPHLAEAHNNLGNILCEQNQLEEAERCLKQAIIINPDLANAHYNLGALLLAKGKLDEAITYLDKSLQLKPEVEIIYLDLGNALFQAGRYQEATRILKKGVTFNPKSPDFHSLLGDMHLHANEIDQAIACYCQALTIQPDNINVLSNIGEIYLAQNRLEEALIHSRNIMKLKPDRVGLHYKLGLAFLKQNFLVPAITCFREILEVKPELAEVHFNLGNTHKAQGNVDEAITCFKNALSFNPKFTDAYYRWGNALEDKGEWDEAISCYQTAIQIKPDFVQPLLNMGNIHKIQGRTNEALACYLSALQIKPDFADALNNLGVLFQEQEDWDEAITYYQKALLLNPGLAEAKCNLGIAYARLDLHNEATSCFKEVLKLKPEYLAAQANLLRELQKICQWGDYDEGVMSLRRAVIQRENTANNKIDPFVFLALPGTTASEQKSCAELLVQRVYNPLRSLRNKHIFKHHRIRNTQIHIGYLSADFKQHPVSFLMAELIELHDRNRFKVSAYSFSSDDYSNTRKRLEHSFDNFVDIENTSYEDTAKLIYSDRVDILIDLTGYTHNSRSAILALRPAPIQVNFLGYPGTMGADFVDYLIADQFVIPPEHQSHYTETVIHMPDCFMPSDRTRPQPAAPSRKDCGLPEDGFVFCCFNQTYKITPDIFNIWCNLLIAVPDSILWLPASNTQAEINLKREAKNRGVASERIVTAAKTPKIEDHLARLQCADLFLDTIPYNAHATCSDALWMGLPVITCVGETFPSRVAGSLLTALRVPELITYNLEDYYNLALNLATNRMKLEVIRNKIISNRDTAPLFDSVRFTRNLEKIYLQMVENFEQHFNTTNNPPS